MGARPTGAVTFLFTDIEGSTQMWEYHAAEMERALALHDAVLNAEIEAAGGYLFSTAGDAFSVAFARAEDAVTAAKAAQQKLAAVEWPPGAQIKVRMGLHIGVAHERDGDYFGRPVNRAARIMSAGHGGQILLSSAIAELADADEFVYLGEHRLKDLSEPERIYQVRESATGFAPLRTLDSTPGNLPVLATSFVGRDAEMKELCDLVRLNRVITLTGVGGVGKTRLAVQVAAELTQEFPDGVWLVELAPVGDPAAVPDVVAAALGVTARPGLSVVESVARAMTGRRLLIVLDNCEHVLDEVAGIVETILVHTSTAKFLATSREGMRVTAERVWPVPSLDVASGIDAAAVRLFADRAEAVNPGFDLDREVDAVAEICTRLDGIALAIELAAARMTSMTAEDVRDRLDDRFRLLTGARRGLERHQTLRHAVRWSYDLLEPVEQSLLDRCSVFADGFDLQAATSVSDGDDEFEVLDLLDSLVRKSLITVETVRDRSRYGMLETIRQFADERLFDAGLTGEVGDAHAAHFAREAVRRWESWEGPQYRSAVDWLDAELDNLRAGFRWAFDRGDLTAACAIAAHATMLGQSLQIFEPAGWAEELIDAATNEDIRQLPRLYTAASLCLFSGRPGDALEYARKGVELGRGPRYEAFPHGLHRFREANVYHFTGRLDEALEIFVELTAEAGPAHVYGACGQTSVLVGLGRVEEASQVAEEALAAASALGNPYWVASALHFRGRTWEMRDPGLAMETYERGLTLALNERVPFVWATLAVSAARLEAVQGDLVRALDLYGEALDSMHRSGNIANVANVALTFASLVSTFERLGRLEAAATVSGVIGDFSHRALEVPTELLERLSHELGRSEFERCRASGAAMEPAHAVGFIRAELGLARAELIRTS